jgi:hypothetical protein
MTDRRIVQIIHDCLRDKSKWYINPVCAENMEDICEQAKERADNALSNLSTAALYNRYRLWRDSEPIIPPNAHYFHEFLNDLVWNLGKSSLKGRDLYLYEELCSLEFHFVKS